MANKTQVARKAQAIGAELMVDGSLVTLYAPDGYTLGEYHIVGREAIRDWCTKADIYDEMFDLLDDLRKCDSDCQH